MKSTVDEIRERFDHDVERFSNLETGQSATIDAPLALDLVTRAASLATPAGTRMLDIGCGAGNFTLRMLQRLPIVEATLVDLSRPMLDRAVERVAAARNAAGNVCATKTIQSDIRTVELERASLDIIVAGAVLHHLRTDEEWHATFAKLFHSLRPGGSFWIFDLVTSATPEVEAMQRERYGEYLATLKGEEYRDAVFAYIEKEDTPRPLFEQLDLLKRVGFAEIEVLHVNACFAAFGGVKR